MREAYVLELKLLREQEEEAVAATAVLKQQLVAAREQVVHAALSYLVVCDLNATSVSGAKLLVCAEKEGALKQQLRCTQEVLEAAREQEEEAAAAAVALKQVSYLCYIPTYMLQICPHSTTYI